MRVAQSLYENGYITYMRTDSVTLSGEAIKASRAQAAELYGSQYVPDKPRILPDQVAERPGGARGDPPRRATASAPRPTSSGSLSGDEFRLYELIWKRTVASQMADAKGTTSTVELQLEQKDRTATFRAAGTVITFRGFLAAYEEGRDASRYGSDEAEGKGDKRLPQMEEGQKLDTRELHPGRPLHHASPAVHRGLAGAGPRGARHRPSLDLRLHRRHRAGPWLCAAPRHRPGAQLDRLRGGAPAGGALRGVHRLRLHRADGAAAGPYGPGRAERGRSTCKNFYLSDGTDGPIGLKPMVDDLGDIDARAINSIAIGEGITLRVGRYGAYVERDRPGRERRAHRGRRSASGPTSPMTSPPTS